MDSKNGGGDSLRHTATTQPRDIPNSISTACKQCMHYYQALCDILQDITPEDANQYDFDRQPSLATTQDARMRFKAWAVNIAALHGEHLPSSLDFRLKDTTEIRQRILKVLQNLKESLVSAISIANGTEPNETWESGAISDSEDEGTNPLEEVTMTSGLDELFTAIKTSNSSLMKISMVIRSSPARDDYLKAASRYRFDPRYDIGHVKEKHGSARRSSGWLLERLGKAITRRRQYLKYRAEHHSKLSREWAEVPDPEIVDDVKTDNDKPDDVKPDKTIAFTKYTKATTFIENVVISHSQAAPQDGSQMGGSFGSQTSYEATIAGETTEIRLTVPPHPQMAFEGVPFEFREPFQCPYCYTEQTVKNRAAWKKHVFRDLKPYVCTFRKCDLRMFKSRNEWFAHEIQAHRREWTCPHCEVKPFTTSTLFENHLAEMHHLNGTQLEALVLQSEEPVDKISASACHLCDEWETDLLDSKHDSKRMFLNDGKTVEPYASLKQFRRHLGRHMEQLALFSLPMHEGEEMEDDSVNNEKEEDDSDSEDDLEEPEKIQAEVESLSRPTSPSPTVGQLEGAPYANKYHEKPYILKCICDYEEDDGHTIQCTTCKTWQHMLCYFSPYDDMSWANSYSCVDCKPRPLDRDGANQRQQMSKERRREKELVDSGGASATNTQLAPTEAWGVSPEDEASFDKIFDSLDTGNKGYITIPQCAEVFASSNLPENIVVRIWELANIAANDHLTRDEFAVAMYYIVLCQDQPISDPQFLPYHLPPHLVPTSLRRGGYAYINPRDHEHDMYTVRAANGEKIARLVKEARLKFGLNVNVATFKERGEELEINNAKSQDETEVPVDQIPILSMEKGQKYADTFISACLENNIQYGRLLIYSAVRVIEKDLDYSAHLVKRRKTLKMICEMADRERWGSLRCEEFVAAIHIGWSIASGALEQLPASIPNKTFDQVALQLSEYEKLVEFKKNTTEGQGHKGSPKIPSGSDNTWECCACGRSMIPYPSLSCPDCWHEECSKCPITLPSSLTAKTSVETVQDASIIPDPKRDRNLVAIGVFVDGRGFKCQYKYYVASEACPEFLPGSEELQDHFETKHHTFTQSIRLHLFICSSCRHTRNVSIEVCPSCSGTGTYQNWIYGHSSTSSSTIKDIELGEDEYPTPDVNTDLTDQELSGFPEIRNDPELLLALRMSKEHEKELRDKIQYLKSLDPTGEVPPCGKCQRTDRQVWGCLECFDPELPLCNGCWASRHSNISVGDMQHSQLDWELYWRSASMKYQENDLGSETERVRVETANTGRRRQSYYGQSATTASGSNQIEQEVVASQEAPATQQALEDREEWEIDENELQKEREETNNLFEIHSSLSHFIETRLGLGMSHADWKREMTAAGYDWTGGIRNQVGEMELAYFREEIQELRSVIDENLRHRGRKQSLESILELLKGNEGIGVTPHERAERRRQHRLLGPNVKIRTLQNYVRQWDNEERAADGPPTEDILTRTPSKVTTMLHGKTLDVTNLEIDADYLEFLPEDLREEVIVQAVADKRVRAAAANTELTTDDQELFNNLSKAIQDEILEQEKVARRRRERETAPPKKWKTMEEEDADYLATLAREFAEQNRDILKSLSAAYAAEKEAAKKPAQLDEQGYINTKSGDTPEPAQFSLPMRDSTSFVDVAPRIPLSDDECRKKLTTYEIHVIQKMPPSGPEGEIPSWARCAITRSSLRSDEIEDHFKKLNGSQRLTVSEKKQALTLLQRRQINNLLDEVNASEGDIHFHYSLAQLDSSTISLPSGQRETTVIRAYLRRALIKEVDPVTVYQALEKQKGERMAALTLTRPPHPPTQARIHNLTDAAGDNRASLQEEGLEQLSKPIESDSEVEFEDVATRSDVGSHPSIPLSRRWWKCCSCSLEVLSTAWGYACPDCSHYSCGSCRAGSSWAADDSQAPSSASDVETDPVVKASLAKYKLPGLSDRINIRYQGEKYVLRFASGSMEDGSLLLEDVRTKAAAKLGIPKEQSWNLSFTHNGHLNPFDERTPWRDLKLKRYAELEFFLLPNPVGSDAVKREVDTGAGSNDKPDAAQIDPLHFDLERDNLVTKNREEKRRKRSSTGSGVKRSHTERGSGTDDENNQLPSRSTDPHSPDHSTVSQTVSQRPTLQDILEDKAPPPWTLAAFSAFLDRQAQKELDFIMHISYYNSIYRRDENKENPLGLWREIMREYVKLNGPQEVFLPSHIQESLVALPSDSLSPDPKHFEPARKIVFDRLNESALPGFFDSLEPAVGSAAG